MPVSPPAGIHEREHWLDALAKRLATRASRRRALAGAGAGLLGGVLASLLPRRAQGYAQGAPCGPGGSCPPGETCVAGLCLGLIPTSPCPRGWSQCGGQCVNTQADPNHCGGCGTQCSYGVPCSSGACTIEVLPGPACANTVSDPNNCGRCGNVCTAPPGGVATCANGACGTACPPGFLSCSSGTCVPAGGCCTNADCPAGQTCANGACSGASQPAPPAQAAPAPICNLNAGQTVSGSNPTTTGGQITVSGTGTGTLVVSPCAPPAGGAAAFGPWFDVHWTANSNFTAVEIKVCGVQGSDGLVWLTSTGTWQAVTPPASFNSQTGCLAVSVTATSSPSLAELTGTTLATYGRPGGPCGFGGIPCDNGAPCCGPIVGFGTGIGVCPPGGFYGACCGNALDGYFWCSETSTVCCGNTCCAPNTTGCCTGLSSNLGTCCAGTCCGFDKPACCTSAQSCCSLLGTGICCNPGETCCAPLLNSAPVCCGVGSTCNGGCVCDAGACAAVGGCCLSGEGIGCVAPSHQNEDQCGTGGGACQICAAASTCQNGRCICTSTGQPPVNGSCSSQPCDSTTCPHGCCDGITCVPGTSDNNACGQPGNQCFACSGGSTCVGGYCICPGSGVLVSPWGGGWCPCVPPCTSGCCDVNMVCRPGNTNAACGTLGGACFTCPDGNSCQGGACGGVCQGGCAPGSCQGQCCSDTGPGCDACCCGSPYGVGVGPLICYGSCALSDPDCPAR